MKSSDSFVSLDSLQDQVRDRAASAPWRSLDQLAGTAGFNAFLNAEFPAAVELTDLKRRDFIKLMGASIALAGATGCSRQPQEKILPYGRQPEQLVPGKPLYFATALPWQGLGRGVLVESHMGRPTKIEGNPDHPASFGKSDALMQAAILDVYDPDRSQVPKNLGRIATWTRFVSDLKRRLVDHEADQGKGLRILTGPISSPTLGDQLHQLLTRFPAAKWHHYSPVGRDTGYAGTEQLFGQPLEALYHLTQADVIVSLDADFLTDPAAGLAHTRDFAAGRRSGAEGGSMNRLYVAECTPTLTGAAADHRLAVSPSELQQLAAAFNSGDTHGLSESASRWLQAVLADCKRNRGRCVIIPGQQQPAAFHAQAHHLNQSFANVGRTVTYTEPATQSGMPTSHTLVELRDDMAAGAVSQLVIIGVNPVYDTPPEMRFAQLMELVASRIHLGLYEDETARLCHWHIPQAHTLESWGDIRAIDGTVTIQQPLIAPLYDGKSALDLISSMQEKGGRKGYDLVRDYWQPKMTGLDFETAWQTAIHNGTVAGSALPVVQPTIKAAPPPLQQASSWSFDPTPPFMMAVLPTMPGYRSCPNPSAN
ncbi:MAG: TAT-variant-translocated molybdopterin oxidoreductase [Verrucomicrobia bacterium]|nr:TAT-variant-translocated molybdopterin oxidoreductase [Verrucomicrobiota bacterium]